MTEKNRKTGRGRLTEIATAWLHMVIFIEPK